VGEGTYEDGPFEGELLIDLDWCLLALLHNPCKTHHAAACDKRHEHAGPPSTVGPPGFEVRRGLCGAALGRVAPQAILRRQQLALKGAVVVCSLSHWDPW